MECADICRPKYDTMMGTITFDYTVLPVNASGLPGMGGVVNTIVADYNGAEGSGSGSVRPLSLLCGFPSLTPSESLR